MKEFLNMYDSLKENAENRYFPPHAVEEILNKRNYSFEIIGKSVNNRPIYLLRKGMGKIKILCWAQMHGNESTASRAMFDIWKVFELPDDSIKKLLSQIEVHFIPQLNPDGAQAYTRLNHSNLDINRDFNVLKTPEMKALREIVMTEDYDILFNLHDQRTIFHPEYEEVPATLSFLAPVVDNEQSIPPNRLNAMKLISCMIEQLKMLLPNQFAKFSDEFYPEATGDNFQRLGYTTILIECGHYPNDYQRNITRRFTFYAILEAFKCIAEKKYLSCNTSLYENLPTNDDKAFDILYKNILTHSHDKTSSIDLGIQFEEILEKDRIKFVGKIYKKGDLSNYFGHDIYHAENRLFENNLSNEPKIGDLANFNLGEWHIKNGKISNDTN